MFYHTQNLSNNTNLRGSTVNQAKSLRHSNQAVDCKYFHWTLLKKMRAAYAAVAFGGLMNLIIFSSLHLNSDMVNANLHV